MAKGKYHVYVIDLRADVMDEESFARFNRDMDPQKGCVYVGMTSQTPEIRFQDHKEGRLYSQKIVKNYGVRLNKPLYRELNPLESEEEAKEKEQWLAQKLYNLGYGVWVDRSIRKKLKKS